MAPPKGKPFCGKHYEGGRKAGAASRWHLANIVGWSEMTKQQRQAWNLANWRKTPKGREQNEDNKLNQRFQRYGLTLDQYHSIAEKQDFRCAICGDVPEARTRKDNVVHRDGFVVDHNHVTGKVRGLLCTNCNVGIGMLKNSSEVLLRASTYMVN